MLNLKRGPRRQKAAAARGPDTCQRKKGRRMPAPAFSSGSSGTCGARADVRQVCSYSRRRRRMDGIVSLWDKKRPPIPTGGMSFKGQRRSDSQNSVLS